MWGSSTLRVSCATSVDDASKPSAARNEETFIETVISIVDLRWIPCKRKGPIAAAPSDPIKHSCTLEVDMACKLPLARVVGLTCDCAQRRALLDYPADCLRTGHRRIDR